MLKLAAFADEISPDLDEQIRVCRANDITEIELRGVAGKNVLDFDAALRALVRRKLADNGLSVLCIASPIGKAKITDPWEPYFQRFKIAVELADYFQAPFIRIFSYYPPQPDQDMAPHRPEVLRRMRAKLDYLAARAVTLIHENEKEIYGQTGQACLDLMRSIDSPQFRSAFDFANFVQVGQRPLDNWPLLKPWTAHIHIKDALLSSGKVVPAGQGDGQLGPILADAYQSGYRGSLSLEPHLLVAGHSHGETGPELFKVATDALKNLCKEYGVPLACG